MEPANVALTGREWRILIAAGLPLVVGSLNFFGATLALTVLSAMRREFGGHAEKKN